MQPHWPLTPPPPQVLGEVQVPQSSIVPQPSESDPHEIPSPAQVLGTQAAWPHLLGPPPPQTSGDAHSPQCTVPLQPSDAVPHSSPSCAQVLVTHVHWNCGLQDCPPTQVPQESTEEQPSDGYPHCAPRLEHDLGLQGAVPQTLGPPPPQVCPCGHGPQSTLPPHPSGAEPQCAPSAEQVIGEQGPTDPSPASCPASVQVPPSWATGRASTSGCGAAHEAMGATARVTAHQCKDAFTLSLSHDVATPANSGTSGSTTWPLGRALGPAAMEQGLWRFQVLAHRAGCAPWSTQSRSSARSSPGS